TLKNNNLPDMGIVNCRYSLTLSGNKRQLRLSSWDALPRLDKTIPFPWKAGDWFRCKLVVEQQGDWAVVRGEVWPRAKPERREGRVIKEPFMRIIPSVALAAVALGMAAVLVLRPTPPPARAGAEPSANGVAMFGGSPARNMVNLTEKNIPDEWDVQSKQNIKW